MSDLVEGVIYCKPACPIEPDEMPTNDSSAKLAAHIQSVVASAPAPTPAQVQELARLLTPVMLRDAALKTPDATKEKDEWDV